MLSFVCKPLFNACESEQSWCLCMHAFCSIFSHFYTLLGIIIHREGYTLCGGLLYVPISLAESSSLFLLLFWEDKPVLSLMCALCDKSWEDLAVWERMDLTSDMVLSLGFPETQPHSGQRQRDKPSLQGFLFRSLRSSAKPPSSPHHVVEKLE